MREDCKYFQLRSYAAGEVARFCALELAPEAPWRCPASCPRYTPQVDVRRPGPVAETLAPAPADGPSEPELHPDAVALLSSAAEIIGAVGPEMAAERRRQREEEERRSRTWWNRVRGRSPRWRQ